VLMVGLTGGIGAGKSTVAGRLARAGAVVVDADALAREVLAPATPGLAAVLARFGDRFRTVDGSLDRTGLGRLVFADPDARAALNAIVHPLVRARFAAVVAATAATAAGSVLVHDVPLLVELGMGPQYHLVVVVGAPAEERVRRLVTERAMAAADARARLAAQASDQQRRAAADVWLDNTRATPELLTAVDRLWRDRLAPYAANLATGRRTRRPDVPVLVSHDPAWAGQTDRLGARIAWLCREHPRAGELSVAHIGSTAIPGVRAKAVLDLQLAVPSLAVADELEPALSSGGFVRIVGVGQDNPKPVDPDPAHWHKRFYGGCDPGQLVHLHVRATGSAGWRYALLMRDWLRADPAAAADYQAHKLYLAAVNASTDDYAAAKEPWFDKALPLAHSWAVRTGWTPSW